VKRAAAAAKKRMMARGTHPGMGSRSRRGADGSELGGGSCSDSGAIVPV
jgi:hypothetical protein